MEQGLGQVFWLVDRPTCHAFPSRHAGQWLFGRLSSPLTAAGPRRLRTVFPAPNPLSEFSCLYDKTELLSNFFLVLRALLVASVDSVNEAKNCSPCSDQFWFVGSIGSFLVRVFVSRAREGLTALNMKTQATCPKLMIEFTLATDNGPLTTDKRSGRTGQKLSSESGIGIFRWEVSNHLTNQPTPTRRSRSNKRTDRTC